MRFLVDAQLPPAFARWLAAQGHEAVGPPVIWIRAGNLRTAALIERCGSLWRAAVDALERGERLIEIS